MSFLTSTHQHQTDFAAYCRTGNLKSIPGIHKKNILQYRTLVLNVIDDTLQNAYPLTYDLLQEEEWKELVTDFFANHSCQSPQVWYMPKEMYEYVLNTGHPLLKKYFFLQELLWFEWIELEMFMMEDKYSRASQKGDILFSKLILNPEHQLLPLNYPIHKKNSRDITITDKGNYFVIVHRNAKGDVVFNDISPSLVRMVEYLVETPISLSKMFHLFQIEFGIELSETDQNNIVYFFENAFQQGLILGFENI